MSQPVGSIDWEHRKQWWDCMVNTLIILISNLSWPKGSELAATTNVLYNSLLGMCTLNPFHFTIKKKKRSHNININMCMRLADSSRTAHTPLYLPVHAVPPYSLPTFFFLSRTEEPAKASTCAHDRCALQQLALNVHVKHSDLT